MPFLEVDADIRIRSRMLFQTVNIRSGDYLLAINSDVLPIGLLVISHDTLVKRNSLLSWYITTPKLTKLTRDQVMENSTTSSISRICAQYHR